LGRGPTVASPWSISATASLGRGLVAPGTLLKNKIEDTNPRPLSPVFNNLGEERSTRKSY